MSERPTLRSNRSAIEGIEPVGSSSAMRSMRCMGKKTRSQADAVALGMQNLADEIVEGVEIDAAHGDAGGVHVQQFAPHFFARRVEADDDDRVQLHLGTRAAIMRPIIRPLSRK